MTRTVAIIALGLSLVTTTAIAQNGNSSQLRPPASYTGQWYTAPNGCSYSRAQAPGYPPSWHLILNPHHIGKASAKTRCPVML